MSNLKRLRKKTEKIKEENRRKILDSFKRSEELLRNSHLNPNFSRPIKKPKKNKIILIKKKKKKPKNKALIVTSKGEYKISLYLKENNIGYISEKEFEGLINPKTGYSLRFDFYIPKMNICIEYDGIQHFQYYRPIHGKCPIKGNLEVLDQQRRDRIKDEYCKNNDIPLIRISYKQFRSIDEILNEALKE